MKANHNIDLDFNLFEQYDLENQEQEQENFQEMEYFSQNNTEEFNGRHKSDFMRLQFTDENGMYHSNHHDLHSEITYEKENVIKFPQAFTQTYYVDVCIIKLVLHC